MPSRSHQEGELPATEFRLNMRIRPVGIIEVYIHDNHEIPDGVYTGLFCRNEEARRWEPLGGDVNYRLLNMGATDFYQEVVREIQEESGIVIPKTAVFERLGLVETISPDRYGWVIEDSKDRGDRESLRIMHKGVPIESIPIVISFPDTRLPDVSLRPVNYGEEAEHTEWFFLRTAKRDSPSNPDFSFLDTLEQGKFPVYVNPSLPHVAYTAADKFMAGDTPLERVLQISEIGRNSLIYYGLSATPPPKDRFLQGR